MIDGRIRFCCFVPGVQSAARGVSTKTLVNAICFLYFRVLISCVWAVLSSERSSLHLFSDIVLAFVMMISLEKKYIYSYTIEAFSKSGKCVSATITKD